MSGGFFRGTSSEQDTRFSNKTAKLLKTQKFAPELELVVDITKVQMDVMRPWIAARVTELLGFEDEVLINFIYGLLDGKEVDGKHIQIQLTGFMEKNTGRFMKELWSLLTSAQNNISGIPQQFLDAKAEETKKRKAEEQRIFNEIQRKKDQEKAAEQEREHKFDVEAGSLRSSTAVAVINREPDLENRSPRSEREKSFDRTPEANRVLKTGASASMRLSSEPSSCKENGKRTRSDSHSTSSLKSSSSPSLARRGLPSIRGRRHHARSISITPPRRRASGSPVSRQHSPFNRRVPQRRLRSPPQYRSPARRRRSPSRSPSHQRRRHAPLHSPTPPSRRKYQRSPSPSRRRQLPHSRSPRRRRHSPRRLHSPSSRRFSPFPSRSPPIRRHSPTKRVRLSLQSLSPVRVARSPRPSQLPARQLLSPPQSRSPVKPLPSPLHSCSPEIQFHKSVQSYSPVRCVRPTRQSSSPARRLQSSMLSFSPPKHLQSPRRFHSPNRGPRIPSERHLGLPAPPHPSSKNGKSALQLQSPPRGTQSPRKAHSSPRHSPSPSHPLYMKSNCSILHPNSPSKRRSQSPMWSSKNKLDPSSHLDSQEERRSSAVSHSPQIIVESSGPQPTSEVPSFVRLISPKRELLSLVHPGSPAGLKSSTMHAFQKKPSSGSALPSTKMLSGRVEVLNGPFVHAASPPSTDKCRRSPGRSEERREAKRRRKEEKRLRKEQRRKKREERRKKREERRAAKTAAKMNMSATGWVSPRVQVSNESGSSDGDHHAPETMPLTEEEEMEIEQKRIENELRIKALESLKARKGISSS